VIIRFQHHLAAEGIGFALVKGVDQVQHAFAIAHIQPLLPWTDPPAGDTGG
jgi:hypothetical protein